MRGTTKSDYDIFRLLDSRFIFMLPYIVTNFFFNNQPDTLVIPILFCYKTLHVLGIFSAHHQEFSTVHLALVSFMQVFDDHFQRESRWNCSSILTLRGIFTASGWLLKKKSDSRLFGHDKATTVETEIISLLPIEGHNCREDWLIDTISLFLGLCPSPEVFLTHDDSEASSAFISGKEAPYMMEP